MEAEGVDKQFRQDRPGNRVGSSSLLKQFCAVLGSEFLDFPHELGLLLDAELRRQAKQGSLLLITLRGAVTFLMRELSK